MKNKLIPIVTAVLALAIGLYFGLKPQSGPDYPLSGYTFDTPQGGSLDLAEAGWSPCVVRSSVGG